VINIVGSSEFVVSEKIFKKNSAVEAVL